MRPQASFVWIQQELTPDVRDRFERGLETNPEHAKWSLAYTSAFIHFNIILLFSCFFFSIVVNVVFVILCWNNVCMSCSPQLLPIHCNRQRQSQDAGKTKSDPIQHCSVLRVISVTTIALTDYPVSINLTSFVYMLNFVTHAKDAGKTKSHPMRHSSFKVDICRLGDVTM